MSQFEASFLLQADRVFQMGGACRSRPFLKLVLSLRLQIAYCKSRPMTASTSRIIVNKVEKQNAWGNGSRLPDKAIQGHVCLFARFFGLVRSSGNHPILDSSCKLNHVFICKKFEALRLVQQSYTHRNRLRHSNAAKSKLVFDT